jgi:hypothetical protein
VNVSADCGHWLSKLRSGNKRLRLEPRPRLRRWIWNSGIGLSLNKKKPVYVQAVGLAFLVANQHLDVIPMHINP